MMSSTPMAILKMKMQALRDEVDKYKDMLEDKCRDYDEEKRKRSAVSAILLDDFMGVVIGN